MTELVPCPDCGEAPRRASLWGEGVTSFVRFFCSCRPGVRTDGDDVEYETMEQHIDRAAKAWNEYVKAPVARPRPVWNRWIGGLEAETGHLRLVVSGSPGHVRWQAYVRNQGDRLAYGGFFPDEETACRDCEGWVEERARELTAWLRGG